MLGPEKRRFLALLQSRPVLARAAVILVEGAAAEVWRWHSADPRLGIALCQIDSANETWSDARWRHYTQPYFARIGVLLTDVRLAGVVGGSHACFLGVSEAAHADSQTVLLEACGIALGETQMSSNMQYLSLQAQMQHANRSFTAIAGIMATKYATVRKMIRNVR